jgi:hypothetical protein
MWLCAIKNKTLPATCVEWVTPVLLDECLNRLQLADCLCLFHWETSGYPGQGFPLVAIQDAGDVSHILE